MSTETREKILGKYQPIATLGMGGMAHVLLTVAKGPAGVTKLLVVKELRAELASDGEFVEMFLDEARIAARLNHPNVIQTFEVCVENGVPFLVMEFLEGQSLHHVLGKIRRENVPLDVHLSILVKALAGLHYAHELTGYDGVPLGVVHRDVSPQNIFVCYDGQVKLVDFGVAKVSGSIARTGAGTFKGKLGYVAPEHLAGGTIDRRADLFAVGVLLWEALSRRRLTAGDSDVTVAHKRVLGEHIRAAELPGVPGELAAICDRAMSLDPNARYATAQEMQLAIEAYLHRAGGRIGERDIASLVGNAFRKERERLREIVDGQIGRLSSGAIRIELPDLGGNPEPFSTHSHKALASIGGTSSTTPPKGTRNLPVVVGTVVLAAGALVGAVVVGRARFFSGPTSNAGAPLEAPATGAVDSSAPPVSSKTVTIFISVQPAKAALQLDGVALAANPSRLVVPADTQLHRISALAEGFVAEERVVAFQKDETFEFSLTRAPGSSPAIRASDPVVSGEQLKRSQRPKRAIDEKDPYQ